MALTGGIATGKSYVLGRFGALGVPTLDADELAHGAMGVGMEATRAIAERFGERMLTADGAVDRRALGALVFADSEARHALETIVHPAVYRSIAAGFRAFELIGGAPMAIADIPLLYETGHEKDFDSVIATICSPALQIERLLQRGLSREDAALRLAAQLPAQTKADRADYVISTDGSFEETNIAVEAVKQALSLKP